jgi:hypothetical protein
MRTHLKRFSVMFGLSWMAGAAAITLALSRHSAEDFSLPDLIPMYLMIAVFGLLLAAVIAFPALLFLWRRIAVRKSVWLYALMGALLIALPVAIATGVVAFVSGNLPVSEAILFTIAFTVLGLTFGLMFFKLYGKSRPKLA